MWWKREQRTEFLPWYRVPGFKGKVSEAEKRQFDAFRMQERHRPPPIRTYPKRSSHKSSALR
ncbi:UNVERIFIED_ORG: hypothetical protein J2W19_004903 [Shinella zoogloeoides]|jgi:hypothetical protein|nr:hypothetical protein [Shinella zoogloeoides]